MKKITIIIASIFLSQTLFSQIKISGTIKDNQGSIPYANVLLKDAFQNIKAHEITDDNGFFELNTTKGKYTLEVSFLGYKEWKKEIDLKNDMDMETILMETSSEQLGEVVVQSKIPVFERKADRLIFNVDQSIAAQGGNALDAMQVAPGLIVENNGINMLGRGAARVMIDGRMLQLSGEELVGFLNSISADDIKKIEIITNPPAKYEAGSSAGLINIIYKKGMNNYWKGSTTFSNSKSRYNFSSLRGNFLYSKNKVNLSLNLNGTKGDERQIETTEARYSNGHRETFIEGKKQKDAFSGRLAIDYKLTENTSIGAQYLGNFTAPDYGGVTTTNMLNNTFTIDSLYETPYFEDRSVNSQIYNFHLVSKLDTLGRSISFDFDYFDFNNTKERNYTANTLNSNRDFLNINRSETNFSDQSIDNFSAKVDVEHPLKAFQLSYGAKVSFIKTTNDLMNFNKISGESIFDPTASNKFEYDENVQALYVNGNKSLNDKVSLQVGLRLENTMTKGYSVTLNQTNEDQYLKLFPTCYISYTKNDNNTFAFNYGRRISRPWFRNLNPFRIYSNSNNYSEGNPFLRPSFSDNFEAVHTFKQVLTTVAYVTFSTNGSGTIFSADDETNIQAIIRRNYFDDYFIGIGEVYMFNKFKWWESQNQFFVTKYVAKFDQEIIAATPKNGFRFYTSSNNTIFINNTTKIQLNCFYVPQQNGGLSSTGQRYGVDIGVKKSFLNKKLQLALFAKDIFDTGSINNSLSEVNGVEVNFGMNYSRRYLRLAMTYDFGNNKINVRERRFGNDDETRRSN